MQHQQAHTVLAATNLALRHIQYSCKLYIQAHICMYMQYAPCIKTDGPVGQFKSNSSLRYVQQCLYV
jgi:hypothetical protein